MKIEEEYLKNIDKIIDLAIGEDIQNGDITTESIISKEIISHGILKAKDSGIICGLKVAQLVFKRFDKNIVWDEQFVDGDKVNAGQNIVKFSGQYNSILSAERTALNFLQRMSGISTKTNQYVEILSNYKTKLLDTRKTLPSFRLLDKYAVKIGGGTNHRYGLYDQIMIKDNHIEVAGNITNAVNQVKNKYNNKFKIEVETKNLDEVKEALCAEVDIIMLDNMSLQEMENAVKLVNGKVLTEASGNINLKTIEDVAKTGVDFISVGELTHSVKAFDIGLYIK